MDRRTLLKLLGKSSVTVIGLGAVSTSITYSHGDVYGEWVKSEVSDGYYKATQQQEYLYLEYCHSPLKPYKVNEKEYFPHRLIVEIDGRLSDSKVKNACQACGREMRKHLEEIHQGLHEDIRAGVCKFHYYRMLDISV